PKIAPQTRTPPRRRSRPFLFLSASPLGPGRGTSEPTRVSRRGPPAGARGERPERESALDAGLLRPVATFTARFWMLYLVGFSMLAPRGSVDRSLDEVRGGASRCSVP